MDPHPARRLQAGAPQHGRPVDGVEPGDVLADDVQIGRPPVGEGGGVGREAGAGDVVDEGVVPDVDGARLGVPAAILQLGRLAILGDRERDAPAGAGPADREILEPAADEAEHLVAAVVRLDELGMLGEVALKAGLVGRQAEEPVALGQPLQRHVRMVRADRAARGLLDVRRAPEALVRAVPAFVRAEVDVAVGVGSADHLLGGQHMVRIRRPDEPIRCNGQRPFRDAEAFHLLVDEVPW